MVQGSSRKPGFHVMSAWSNSHSFLGPMGNGMHNSDGDLDGVESWVLGCS